MPHVLAVPAFQDRAPVRFIVELKVPYALSHLLLR